MVGGLPVPHITVGAGMHLFDAVVPIAAVAVDQLVHFPVLVQHQVDVAADQIVAVLGLFRPETRKVL